MGTERRQFHRAPEELQARCRHCGALEATWRPIVTLDLSAGGMRFKSEDAFEPGSLLEIELPMPHGAERFILRSRLLWTKDRSPREAEHGVEFLGVTETEQLQLDALVDFLRKPR